MKINHFLVYGIVILFGCTIPETKYEFRLEGRINVKNGPLICQYIDSSGRNQNDTVQIQNGKFRIQGVINRPTKAKLRYPQETEPLSVYLEPGKLTLTIDTADQLAYKMSGSETNRYHQDLQRLYQHYRTDFGKIVARLTPIEQALVAGENPVTGEEREKLLSQRNDLEQMLLSLNDTFAENRRNYLIEHPSFLTIDSFNSFEDLPIDSQKNIFYALPIAIRNDKQAQIIEKRLQISKLSAIGSSAPDFKGIGRSDEQIRLSDYQGEYVLLSFWRSGHTPSLRLIPQIKQWHERTNDIQLIAVSFDTNTDHWEKNIQENGIGHWHHLLANRLTTESEAIGIEELYNIGPLPLYLLIDPQGKIIKRWDGTESAEKNMYMTLTDMFKTR